MKRRDFLANALLANALAAGLASPARAQKADAAPALPWDREPLLREAAKTVSLESVLHPDNPQPDFGGAPFPGPSMAINSLKMRTTIWGPAHRVTISLTKNNVWDRRLHEFKPPTLQEITAGAFAPVNKDYVGISANALRPVDLGWLRPEGGATDPYRKPMRYAFPSLKPVGQIILGMDELEGAAAPHLTQNCADGVVRLEIAKGPAQARLEYVLGMTSDIYAIRGRFQGIAAPWLRLYRHRDTSHRLYMTDDGRYTDPAAEADKAFNGPIAAPTSGTDGQYFWIGQKFPAEKTFPQGFEYLLMGVMVSPAATDHRAVQDQLGLGTPPIDPPMNGEWKRAPRPSIGKASGASATARLKPDGNGALEALVTIVTTMDGTDLPAIARRELAAAHALGFDGIVQENAGWWRDFYDRRENGRVFHGSLAGACSDDIGAIYRSYADSHGGGTKTDMRRYECSASYALPERDYQEWDSAPCYNEIFTTSRFVRNWGDSQEMWKQLVWHWLPAAQDNARTMFAMPGMLISHGYLPPVKPDKYVHTTITLELCLGTMAQIIRPAWDEWDYGGDLNVLRRDCYPLLKQMAMFYAAYAKKEADGRYHIVPCMQEESWGIYPRFSRNRDVISSLCMFRWALNRAAESAELLGVDPDLRRQWRGIAAGLAPYPVWRRPEGLVFAEMPDLEPTRLPGDHFGDAAAYPALLSDDVTLDSSPQQQDMMKRSVTTLPSGNTIQALLLLGVAPDSSERGKRYSDDAELYLNSRGGRIHLFPVAAGDAAFRNFQARGGFLVSAARNAAGVYHVEIAARRSLPCRLMNPWPGEPVRVRDAGRAAAVAVETTKDNGKCLTFAARAGRRYLVERAA
ncbi:MAG TPA: hypothetical protein VFI23_12590 [Rhizomicrobium sp.]|nr:hypothetical protein [Rhizomicrobium sp.]